MRVEGRLSRLRRFEEGFKNVWYELRTTSALDWKTIIELVYNFLGEEKDE